MTKRNQRPLLQELRRHPKPGEVKAAVLDIFVKCSNRRAMPLPHALLQERAERYEHLAFEAIHETVKPYFLSNESDAWLHRVGNAAEELLRTLLMSPGIESGIDSPEMQSAPFMPAWMSKGVPDRAPGVVGPPNRGEIAAIVQTFAARISAQEDDPFFTAEATPYSPVRASPSMMEMVDNTLWLAVWARVSKPLPTVDSLNQKGLRKSAVKRELATLAAKDFERVTGRPATRAADFKTDFAVFADQIFLACGIPEGASAFIQKAIASLKKPGRPSAVKE